MIPDGIWLSEYGYESTGRGAAFASRHYVTARRAGNLVTVRSVPASKSKLGMDLEIREGPSAGVTVLIGYWIEETDPSGYYQGMTFFGGILAIVDPDGSRASGKWTGGSRDGLEVNVGPWSLTLVDDSDTPETVEQWNRDPE